MDLKKQLLFKKIYKIIMAVYVSLFVAAFIAVLFVIYFTGPIANQESDRLFSFNSEIVLKMLNYLLIPFIVLICLIILGTVFYLIYPSKENENVKPLPTAILSRVKSYNLNAIEDKNLVKQIKRYKGLRIGVTIFTTCIVIFSFIFSVLYLIQSSNYTLEGSIIDNNINLILNILPFVLLALCWGFAAIFVNNVAANKEISLLKEAKVFKIDRSITSKDYLSKRKSTFAYIGYGLLISAVIVLAVIIFVFGGAGIFVLIAAIVGLLIALLCGKNRKKKINKISQCPLENYNPKVENAFIWIIRALVFVFAITFIILGIFNNGVRDVLIKAINICTECIGLG